MQAINPLKAVECLLESWAAWHIRQDVGYPGASSIVGFKEGVGRMFPEPKPPRNVEIPPHIAPLIQAFAQSQEIYHLVSVRCAQAHALYGVPRAIEETGLSKSTFYRYRTEGVKQLSILLFGR